MCLPPQRLDPKNNCLAARFSACRCIPVSQTSHEASALAPAGARLPRNQNKIRFPGTRVSGAVCMRAARLRRLRRQPIEARLHPTSHGRGETGNQTRYGFTRFALSSCLPCLVALMHSPFFFFSKTHSPCTSIHWHSNENGNMKELETRKNDRKQKCKQDVSFEHQKAVQLWMK